MVEAIKARLIQDDMKRQGHRIRTQMELLRIAPAKSLKSENPAGESYAVYSFHWTLKEFGSRHICLIQHISTILHEGYDGLPTARVDIGYRIWSYIGLGSVV